MSSPAAHRLHGEVETARPLFAKAGEIELHGWCLDDNLPGPAEVRLTTAVGSLPALTGLPRGDVASFFPKHPAAQHCGFSITGKLPHGVHLACIEARASDGSWQCLQRFSLAVGKPPFVAVVDEPIKEGVLRDRVRVGGWALQPGASIRELSLRYGHREIPCAINRPRTDVPALFPDVPDADHAGFETKDYLVAGFGPVRVRAKLASGATVVARTKVAFDISSDENHPADLDLHASWASLGERQRPALPPAPEKTARPLNILFILHGSFASNSAFHVAALADELAAAGHACTVAVPHDRETISHHENPLFRAITFAEAEQGCVFKDGRGPDVIHAWTTRENVRQLTGKIAPRHHSRVVVHLEDNELEILALQLGRPVAELENLPSAELDRMVPPDLSHPYHSGEFLAASDGVSVITEKLREFIPPHRPGVLLTPAADNRYFFPRPLPREFRRILDVVEGTTVVFYHGNVHPSNAAEVRELYTAVLQLNRENIPVTLIRTGLDRADFLGAIAEEVAPYVLDLGQIPHHRHLPSLMSLADYFVQPGVPDAFNDYRFPSKLPEFFAIGRPVILPRTNLGLSLRHRVDAYVLDRADAAGIAGAIRELKGDPELASRLAAGAANFAAKHFSWRRTAEALAKFYAALTV